MLGLEKGRAVGKGRSYAFAPIPAAELQPQDPLRVFGFPPCCDFKISPHPQSRGSEPCASRATPARVSARAAGGPATQPPQPVTRLPEPPSAHCGASPEPVRQTLTRPRLPWPVT